MSVSLLVYIPTYTSIHPPTSLAQHFPWHTREIQLFKASSNDIEPVHSITKSSPLKSRNQFL